MIDGFWECRECISRPCIIFVFDPELPHPTKCMFDKPNADWKTSGEWDKIDGEKRTMEENSDGKIKIPQNQKTFYDYYKEVKYG